MHCLDPEVVLTTRPYSTAHSQLQGANDHHVDHEHEQERANHGARTLTGATE